MPSKVTTKKLLPTNQMVKKFLSAGSTGIKRSRTGGMCLAVCLTPLEKIGSVYPLYVYDHNRLLAPILRQKMALSDV